MSANANTMINDDQRSHTSRIRHRAFDDDDSLMRGPMITRRHRRRLTSPGWWQGREDITSIDRKRSTTPHLPPVHHLHLDDDDYRHGSFGPCPRVGTVDDTAVQASGGFPKRTRAPSTTA